MLHLAYVCRYIHRKSLLGRPENPEREGYDVQASGAEGGQSERIPRSRQYIEYKL